MVIKIIINGEQSPVPEVGLRARPPGERAGAPYLPTAEGGHQVLQTQWLQPRSEVRFILIYRQVAYIFVRNFQIFVKFSLSVP